MEKEMVLIFTSFRDSVNLEGLKVALDRHIPRLCSYPTATFLLLPQIQNLSNVNIERVCNVVLDNNWELIRNFITKMYSLGINQIVFCDWATKEQISYGKWCPAGIIGNYIQDKVDQGEFEFGVRTEMRDGREVL